MTAPSPDDLPGLVEAVAEAMWSSAIEHDADSDAPPWDEAQPWDRDWCIMQARAAVAAMVEHLGRKRWQYGVERGPFGEKFPAHIEWGSSDGMTHHYEYTAESVHALASGRPVFRRLVTSFQDVIGEPEPYPREVDHGSE